MKSIPLGNSGINVSALGFGAMYLGTRSSTETSFQLLDEYVEAGGNFIDTANIYSHWIQGYKGGESETLIGEWLRQRGNRDQVIIASKVGFPYQDVKQELSPKTIAQECDRSLKRMGIDTMDVYYAHVDDYTTPIEETLEAFNKLVTAGKVRHIAASNYRAWRLEQAHGISVANGWAQFCCVQQRHTYLRVKPGGSTKPQVASNEDLFDYSRFHQFPIVAYSILLGGAYTKNTIPPEYAGPDTDARLGMLNTIAAETGATINQVVIAWMLHSSYPVIPLIAASSHEQLAENLGALDVKLSAEQMQRLDAAKGGE